MSTKALWTLIDAAENEGPADQRLTAEMVVAAAVELRAIELSAEVLFGKKVASLDDEYDALSVMKAIAKEPKR